MHQRKICTKIWTVNTCIVGYRDEDRNEVVNEKQPSINYLDTCEDKLRSNSKTQTTILCIVLQRVLQSFFLHTD